MTMGEFDRPADECGCAQCRAAGMRNSSVACEQLLTVPGAVRRVTVAAVLTRPR